MNDRQSLPKPLRRRGCPSYRCDLVHKFFLFTYCWVTPPGSGAVRVLAIPASLAPQADTGLWKGDCSAVIIHR